MMKKYFLYILTFIVIIAFLVCCSDDSDHIKALKYTTTTLGGCHNQDFGNLKRTCDDFTDTVIFTIVNDTLDVFVGLNYICCAPFTSNAVAENDSIIITISDTCRVPYNDCYCRCMCYYTWDFKFIDYDEKEYRFKIVLNDPHEKNPQIIKEGKIQITGYQ